MAETKIMPCTCTHQYQDATYGPGKRVHNMKGDGARKETGWVCTVCGKGGRNNPKK